MTDIASIGFKMETDDVARGIKSLETLAQQGPKVEKALDGVEKTAAKAGKSLKSIGEGAGKGLDDVGRAAPKAADGIGRVAKSADDAKRALAGINASVTGLSQVSAAATQSARGMLGFGSSVQASQKSLIDMQAQVRAASTAVAQMSSAMTSALPAMQAAAKAQMDAAKSAVDMGAAFKTAGDQVRSYSTVSARASDANQKAAQSMDATATAARGLASALAVAGVGFGAQELIGMVDGYTKYTAQLKIATRSTTEHAIAIASVQSTATKAQAGIGELATLYARITNATRDLGISQTRVGEITETVALALKANGASAGEASSAMLQLSQAFGSGVLRGEEFNAVYEAAPNLLNELAVAMGKPIGSLRQMAADGKLTADVLAENLPKALGKFREQAAEVQTISGAFTVLKNNIMEMVGAQSNASGTTKALASGINSLANNLDLVAAAGGAVALVFAGRLIGSMNMFQAATIASTAATVRHQIATTAMAASISASSAAMALASRAAAGAVGLLGGPLGAVITVAGLAATAFYAFGNSAGELTKSIGGLGQPLDDLKKRLDALPPEKRISVILDIKEEAAKKAKEATDSFDDLASSVVGAFSGARAASADSAKQVNELVDKLEDAKKTGADMTPILLSAAKSGGVSNATLKSWLDLAANIREAREAAKSGESIDSPGINVGAFPSRGSQAGYLKEREAAAQRLLDISARQNGITKQFTEDLAANAEGLRTGVLTTEQYVAAVTELNKKRYEGTEAGKAAAKQAKAGASGVNAHNQELERQAALLAELSGLSSSFYKDWDSLNKQYAQGRISLKGLEEAQAALLAKQPAMVALAKEEAEVSEARVKAWEEEVKGWQKQVEVRNKAAESAEDALLKAREEERAHALAAAASITLAEAVARLTLARAEDNYQKALSAGADGDTLLALQRETDARRSLIEVMQQKGVREANEKAAEAISKDWEKTSQLIGDTLSDYIMGGGKDAAQYLKRLFATLVLQPIVQTAVGSLLGTGSEAGAGAGASASGGMSLLGGLQSGQSMLSSFSGGLTGSVGSAIAGLGAQLGSTAATAFGSGIAAGGQLGLFGGAIGQGASLIGSGVAGSTAAGLGTMAGAALPWIAGAAALLSVIKSMDDSGTPHSGSGAVYSKATGVQSGAGIYNQSTFGMGHRDEYSEAMQAGISGIAQGLGQTLDAFAVSFGKTAGYSVATAFADDSSKDGAWGSLKIADELGKVLINWEDSRASKWAPREFADGEEGYKEYLSAVAQDVKGAFLAMDIPAWGKQLVDAATDLDSLSAALAQVGTIKTVFDSLGKSLSMFADLSGDAQTTLINTSGGIDALAQNASAFYQGFYSEQERYENSLKQMQDVLAGLNVSIDPAMGDSAKADFRAAVDAAFDAGQFELGAQLLGINQQFAAVADYAQKAGGAIGEVADVLSDVMRDLLDERKPLEADLLRAQGDESGYLSAVRAIATAGYAEAEIAAWDYNAALQAQIDALDAAAAKAAEVAQERAGLEQQILQLQGNTTELRRLELDALDPANRALQERIWALEEEARIAQERTSLQDTLNQLTLTSVELRALEIAKLDETNRPLQERIWLLEEEKRVAEERNNLMTSLYQALGNTGALRADQLKQIDPANRALQEQVWQIEDAKSALEKALQAESESANAAQQAAQERVSAIQGIFDLLKSNVQDLYETASGATKQWTAAQADAFIDNALSNARATGYLPESDDLSDAIAGARAGLDKEYYATEFDKQRDTLVLAGKLEELKELAGPQLTEAQKQLKALEDTLENSRQQIDVLRGIDASVLSVSDAIEAFQTALTGEKTARQAATVATGIAEWDSPEARWKRGPENSFFHMVTEQVRVLGESGKKPLGLTPNELGSYPGLFDTDKNLRYGLEASEIIAMLMGYKSWADVPKDTNNGLLSQATTFSLKNVYRKPNDGGLEWEYSAPNLPIFDVGINNVPYDMTERIHKNEAVVPAHLNPFNPNAKSNGLGGNSARLEALVEGLTAEVKRLQSIVARGVEHQRETAEILDNVTEGGNAMRSEVMA